MVRYCIGRYRQGQGLNISVYAQATYADFCLSRWHDKTAQHLYM